MAAIYKVHLNDEEMFLSFFIINTQKQTRCARVYLFGFESSEAEHPDLIDDVLPVLGGALLLQTGRQLFSHPNDALSHFFDLTQPGMNKIKSGNTYWDVSWTEYERERLEVFSNTHPNYTLGSDNMVCIYASISTYQTE